MKMVKARPGTVNKIRELEVLKDDLKVCGTQGPGNGEGSSTAANGEVMQGLYAFSQTEVYVADPVINVKSSRLPCPQLQALMSVCLVRALFRRTSLEI